MQNKILIGLATVFLSVLGWVWTATYAQLQEISTGLTKVRLDLVQIQTQMMTEERVKDIIEHELLKRGIK